MFDYIKIEGFRSFKKVELDMPRLAVLIGPNGGGKSNFLDLLMLLSEAGNGKLANGVFRRGGFPNISFGFDSWGEVRLDLGFKGIQHPYMLSPSPEVASRVGSATGSRSPVNNGGDVSYTIAMRNSGSGAQVWVEILREQSPGMPSPSVEVLTRHAQTRDKDGFLFGSVFRWHDESGNIIVDRKYPESESELAIFQVKDRDKYPAPYALLWELQRWVFYRDIDVGPESQVRQPALVRPDIQLLPNGGNLSSVLYSIQQNHPYIWGEIMEMCKTACPDFNTVTFPPQGGDGKVFLRWFERPYEKEGVSANLLSDGTLKLLCLFAILKTPDPPPLICIDEPELGLHPDWIKLVAELLQDAAMRTQVIVATHSPHIVAKLEPDQLIVVEKEDGQTVTKQFSREDQDSLAKWLKDFNLADLWLAGHFGGRP
jgi:predicted ATPase